MFYAKSTGGFYDTSIHGNAIPLDAVEITAAQHAQLLADQSTGKRITADATGSPVATLPPAKTAAEVTAETNAVAIAALAKIDIDSIRAMREFLVAKFLGDPMLPQQIITHNAAAAIQRAKIVSK